MKQVVVINELRGTVTVYPSDPRKPVRRLPLTEGALHWFTDAAVIDERNHGIQEIHPPTLTVKAVGVPEYRKKPMVAAAINKGNKMHPCPGAEGGEPCGRMIRWKTVRCRDCWYQMTGNG